MFRLPAREALAEKERVCVGPNCEWDCVCDGVESAKRRRLVEENVEKENGWDDLEAKRDTREHGKAEESARTDGRTANDRGGDFRAVVCEEGDAAAATNDDEGRTCGSLLIDRCVSSS